MKKIFLAIFLLLIFSTTTANAYTVFVGIDDSFDLSSVVGFYFEASGGTLDPCYQNETVTACGYSIDGAVPGDSMGPWYVGSFGSSSNAYWGFDKPDKPDKPFWDTIYPLKSGIILSLTADDPFSLNNFFLAGVNPEGELYLYDLNIIKISLEDCIEGGGKGYIYSAVPIPGSLVLLGSGLIGLIGLGRRRMRK